MKPHHVSPLDGVLDACHSVAGQLRFLYAWRQPVRGAGVVAQLKAEAVDRQVDVLDGALDRQLLACRSRQEKANKSERSCVQQSW
jgi:hypothetical protein